MGIFFQKGVFGLDTKFRRSALDFAFHFFSSHCLTAYFSFCFIFFFFFIFKIPCPHLHVMCNATQIDAHVNLHVYKCIKVQTILQIQY